MSVISDRFVQAEILIGDTPIRYRVAGDTGDPVLYLDGLHGGRWNAALQQLASRYRLFAPDLPGLVQWLSDGQGVQKLAHLFGSFIQGAIPNRRAHIVGTSVGASVALWVAVQAPALVDKLVIASPLSFRPGGVGRLSGLSDEDRLRRLYAHPERLERVDADASVRALDRMELLPTLEPRDDALFEKLGDLHVPVRVLFGTGDGIVPSEAARVYRKHIPRCHVTFVYEAGHVIDVDRPQAFVRLVDEFLSHGEGFFLNRGSTGYMRAPEGKLPTGAI